MMARQGSRQVLRAAVLLLIAVMIWLNIRLQNIFDPNDLAEFEDVAESCKNLYTPQPIGSADVISLNASKAWNKWNTLESSHTKVLGHRRSKPGFLTIGVPSIKRANGITYLTRTLQSLVDETSLRDKSETVIIIFLADFDTKYNEMVVQNLTASFMTYINMGFFQIIQAAQEFYPPLTGLKRNFKDKPERVSWRSKQVIDFAFMFLYGQNISEYYLQLEDDVTCAPNFVPQIKQFIAHQRKHWAILEFSELGFIGKLFKSADLKKLSQFMMTFYEEQPVDWLIRYYRMAMAQHQTILRKPTLFQHMGELSSFDISKPNQLKDRFFDQGEKKWKGDDPPAIVTTNLKAYDKWTVDLVYAAGAGFFWAKDVVAGSSVYIVFDDEQFLDRVAIETGEPNHPNDTLDAGIVELSPKLLKLDETKVHCADFMVVAQFENGQVDASHLQKKTNGRPTKCLRVAIQKDQTHWLVIRQIAVFTIKNKTTQAPKGLS